MGLLNLGGKSIRGLLLGLKGLILKELLEHRFVFGIRFKMKKPLKMKFG